MPWSVLQFNTLNSPNEIKVLCVTDDIYMQIRVSSEISNAPLILNVDCDMYSNNSQSIKDALCFFLDEDAGHDVAFVQFPQNFHNLTNNELYGSLRVISQVMHV